MTYKLYSLEVKHITDTHVVFDIILKKKPWYSKECSYITHSCAKEFKHSQSYFLSTGTPLYLEYIGLDESINAILSTGEKYFLNIK